MQTARELAQDLRDDRQFLGAHPAPALVFGGEGAGKDDSRFDTPPQPFFTLSHRAALDSTPPDGDVGSSTEVMKALELTATGVSDVLQPEARIGWLVKSERNPFASLITVGRTPNNDVIISDARVSKVHAIFTHTEHGWVVSDSHSSNGTYVDGMRLPTGEKRAVDDGAEVCFGREVRARFMHPESLLELLKLLSRSRPPR